MAVGSPVNPAAIGSVVTRMAASGQANLGAIGQAEMVVNGRIFRDWLQVQVRTEWDAPTRDFEFVAAGSSVGSGANSPIDTGASVVIRLNGEPVINGFVEARSPQLAAGSHIVTLIGRSITRDLMDSTVPIGGSYQGSSFPQIARGLLKPHGIKLVINNTPDGFDRPIKRFVPLPGATVWATLERLARMRGVVFSDDRDGNLTVRKDLGTPDKLVAQIVEGNDGGVPFLTAAGVFRDDTVFSQIKAVGQIKADDDFWPSRDVSATRKDDSGGARERTVIGEHAGDRQDMAQRADAEAARLRWTGVQVIVVVQGWSRPDGELWKPTDHLTMKSPSMFLRDDPVTLGVRSVVFSQGLQGTITTMELILPAYLSNRKDSGVSGRQDNLLDVPDNPARPDAPDTQGQT